MSNLVARYSFRDLRGLMARADRSYDAPSFSRVLRKAGHTSPDVKTAQLIIYRHKPIKSSMAENIILAFQKVMRDDGTLAEGERLALSDYTFEYNCYLPDLSHIIDRSMATSNDPEHQPLAMLASQVGCSEGVLSAMTTGSERLVPEEFADRVATGAMMIFKLPQRLHVVKCGANERSLKPIGGDTGRPPDKCEVSAGLRGAIVSWFGEPESQREAAQ